METRRIALVSGAGRGIGAAIARELARAGVGVVVAARTLAECERLADELRQGGAAAWAVELDVGEPQSIARAVARARELAGEVDWLVNNAGIAVSAPLVPKDGSADELYERHLRINFHGARRLAEALLPAMRARKYGRIVNVASMAGLRVLGQIGVYCMSKAAVIHMTKAMALEWGRFGINVNAICPGYIDTEINHHHWQTDAGQKLMQMLPRKRVGAPQDLDAVLMMLCANESHFVNGAVIAADDGFGV